jgi:TonB family protein
MNPSIHAAQVLPARAVLFLGIVGLHVLFAYLFASGLIVKITKVIAPDIIDVIPLKKEAPPRPDDAAPTPPPRFVAASDPVVPDPVFDINMPSDTTISMPREPTIARDPVGSTAALPPPIRLIGRNVMPNTADYYPPSEIRLGNEGTAEIRSCVDASGRLDGTPTVEATSGRAPLDKAAVRLAQDGKYARAVRGNEPVPNCYRFRVTFTLH